MSQRKGGASGHGAPLVKPEEKKKEQTKKLSTTLVGDAASKQQRFFAMCQLAAGSPQPLRPTAADALRSMSAG